MDAAALTMRLPLVRVARTSAATAHGLHFDTLSGPLVAVCGLTGGAGTTTLALSLANAAARESTVPILLTEADPERAGLAAIAGRSTPRPLAALAEHLRDDDVARDTFTELPTELRLIAAPAQRSPLVERHALDTLLGQARAAHGLVVIDCGTTWTADSPALKSATHIVWTAPASTSAIRRIARILDVVAPPPGRAREALAITRIVPVCAVSVRALRRAVRERCEQLVLIDHDHALARGDQADQATYDRALTSLAGLIRRQP